MRVRCANLDVSHGKSDGEVLALSGVSLEMAAGEFVSLVGPSGCGKTTLLRTLAGFVTPRAGTVEHPGETEDGSIGMVLQEDSLFPWMTALENAAFALEVSGIGRREREDFARPMLQHFGLAGRETAYPHQLSAGMKQRVAVARAFLSRASLLLMDEPFGALDAMTRQQLQQDLMREWLASRRTVLFVTHDVEEAILVGSRVLVMSPQPGRIAAEFEVPFDYPRDLSVSLTNAFLEIKREIFLLLGVANLQPKAVAR